MELKKQAVSQEFILTSPRFRTGTQEPCIDRIGILCSRFDAKYCILLCVCEDQHETFKEEFIKWNINGEMSIDQ